MELIPLGISSAAPTKHRHTLSNLLKFPDGRVTMIDCGEGAQYQLIHSDFRASKINRILITHLHGDHVFGLPGLMCTISNQQIPEKQVLHIYGPMGLKQFIRFSLKMSASYLGFEFCIHELVPSMDIPESMTPSIMGVMSNLERHDNEIIGEDIYPNTDNIWVIDEYTQAVPLSHRIATFGYVLKDIDRRGTLDMKACIARGLKPGPEVKRLTEGENVTLENGDVIRPEEVIGPTKIGKRIAFLFDTCNSDRMIPLVQNCDLIVHEATHDDEIMEKAIETGHSTPSMAANFCKLVGAKRLILTHFSSRYEDTNVLVEQAKKVFENVEAAEELKVYKI